MGIYGRVRENSTSVTKQKGGGGWGGGNRKSRRNMKPPKNIKEFLQKTKGSKKVKKKRNRNSYLTAAQKIGSGKEKLRPSAKATIWRGAGPFPRVKEKKREDTDRRKKARRGRNHKTEGGNSR